MAEQDETKTTEEQASGQTEEEGQETGSHATEQTAHPLEPGGTRFNEVYARMKAAEAERDALRSLHQKPAETRSAPQTFTSSQLQALLDSGQITQAQMADQLAWQRAQEMERRMVDQWDAKLLRADAEREVMRYTERKPEALQDARVVRAGYEIQRETGWEATDPRLARRALREVFGSPERLATTGDLQDKSRRTDTHIESSGGGLRGEGKKPPPLDGIDKGYVEYYRGLGYSDEKIVELKPYIKRPFPGHRQIIHGVKERP